MEEDVQVQMIQRLMNKLKVDLIMKIQSPINITKDQVLFFKATINANIFQFDLDTLRY